MGIGGRHALLVSLLGALFVAIRISTPAYAVTLRKESAGDARRTARHIQTEAEEKRHRSTLRHSTKRPIRALELMNESESLSPTTSLENVGTSRFMENDASAALATSDEGEEGTLESSSKNHVSSDQNEVNEEIDDTANQSVTAVSSDQNEVNEETDDTADQSGTAVSSDQNEVNEETDDTANQSATAVSSDQNEVNEETDDTANQSAIDVSSDQKKGNEETDDTANQSGTAAQRHAASANSRNGGEETRKLFLRAEYQRLRREAAEAERESYNLYDELKKVECRSTECGAKHGICKPSYCCTRNGYCRKNESKWCQDGVQEEYSGEKCNDGDAQARYFAAFTTYRQKEKAAKRAKRKMEIEMEPIDEQQEV